MDLIMLGLVGALSAFGTSAFVKKQKKEKEAHYQIEKVHAVTFLEQVIADRVIFRKLSASMGLFATQYQASAQGFVLDVMLTKGEMEFYLHSTKKGRTLYYHYIYNHAMQVGQLLDDSKQGFCQEQTTLLQQLEDKLTHYPWDVPLSFYVKQTFDAFGQKPAVKKSPPRSKTPSPVVPMDVPLQQDIATLDALYQEIVQVAHTQFDLEDLHRLERLYHQDFKRLTDAYLQLQEKTPEQIETMRASLALIEQQLQGFYEKANMHQTQSFERAVAILRERKEH